MQDQLLARGLYSRQCVLKEGLLVTRGAFRSFCVRVNGMDLCRRPVRNHGDTNPERETLRAPLQCVFFKIVSMGAALRARGSVSSGMA